MKKIITLFAIIAVLASCQKQEVTNEVVPNDGSYPTLTASIESTKLALDDMQMEWVAGDLISVTRGGKTAIYEAQKPGITTEFSFVSGDDLGNLTGNYVATYPATGATLERVQPSSDTAVANMPLYAESENTDLHFITIGSLLEFNLTSTVPGLIVNSITIETEEGMSGAYTVDNQKATFTTPGGNAVLDLVNPIVLGTTPQKVYFAVPAGTYAAGMKIVIATTTGRGSCVFTSDQAVTLERRAIHPVTLNVDADNLKSYLLNGIALNLASKKLVNGSTPSATTVDAPAVKSVVFETGADLSAIKNGVDVSYYQDGSVIASFNAGTLKYSTSNDAIFANDTLGYAFNSYKSLTSISGLDKLNTTEVKSLQQMFNLCEKLESVDLSSFDTPKLVNMGEMFRRCWSIKTIKFGPKLNTSKVTNMYGVFSNDTSLVSVDVSMFDTQSATNMSYMFNNCYNLASVDVSRFTTDNVTTLAYMFYACRTLNSIDMSSAVNPVATSLNYMFADCVNLETLDARNFTRIGATQIKYCFSGLVNLKTLRLDKFLHAFTGTTFNDGFQGATPETMLGANATPDSPCEIWLTTGNVIKMCLWEGASWSKYTYSVYMRPLFTAGKVVYRFPGKTNPWKVTCTDDTYTSAIMPTN